MNKGKVFSVSSVNQYIKNMFSREYALSVVFVRGEVSNCKYHSSGHIYFSIKDENSQLTCVMFRGDRGGLDFKMENGQEIIVGGSISVYERDGKYQLYAKKIVLAGDGLLAERYEQLKKKLRDRGYFEEERKQPIPRYAKRIGIVTAKTGAAIHDIIQIATRRNPYVTLILSPAKVQGEGAAQSIVEGIHRLEKESVDVIIIGRGGGSMEDLWAFNEEIVAEAIHECPIPILSAVGHETDFTIADFVADLRAPTPSAAAELAVFDVRNLLETIYDYKDRMARRVLWKIDIAQERLEFLEKQLKMWNPQNRMRENRQCFMDMEEKLEQYMRQILTEKRQQLALAAGRLDGVSPLKRLASGYAFVANERKEPIDSVDKLQEGDALIMTLVDGVVESTVSAIEKREPFL